MPTCQKLQPHNGGYKLFPRLEGPPPFDYPPDSALLRKLAAHSRKMADKPEAFHILKRFLLEENPAKRGPQRLIALFKVGGFR